jgi:hypothetical protein
MIRPSRMLTLARSRRSSSGPAAPTSFISSMSASATGVFLAAFASNEKQEEQEDRPRPRIGTNKPLVPGRHFSTYSVASDDGLAELADSDDRGQLFRLKADSIPTIADSCSRRQRQLSDVIPLQGACRSSSGRRPGGLSCAPNGGPQEEACGRAGVAKVADQLK